MTITKENQTCVIILLLIVFFNTIRAMDNATAVPTPELLQSQLTDDKFLCNVSAANAHQVNISCESLTYHDFPKLFVRLQKANIRELQLIGRGQKKVFEVFPPFYCEIIRLSSYEFKQLYSYTFVNVVGLRELYFYNMSALQQLPMFGYLPHLKVLSLNELPGINKLTDHSTFETWRPLEYKERIFRGAEALQTLILEDMDIIGVTKFDLFDLPNLKYIAPEYLHPDGFSNGVGYLDEMVRESKNPRLHSQREDEFDQLAIHRNDPDMLQTKFNRERLNCTVTRPNQAQIDIWCFKIALIHIANIFNLIQYSNIRILKIENPTTYGVRSLPVVSPIRCEKIKLDGVKSDSILTFAFVNVKGLRELYFEEMPNLRKLPLFGYLPTLKVLGLADLNLGHLTDHSVNATVKPALSLTRIFQGAGLSLQKIVIYRTHIQKITPFDLIDLPNLRDIEPENLRPDGFVNGRGAGQKLRELINNLGFPLPLPPIGFVAPKTKSPPHSTVPPHRTPVRRQ